MGRFASSGARRVAVLMLLGALAACAQITCQMVAQGLRIPVQSVEVVVEDNGRGFAPGEASPSVSGKGVGLFSMRERAELIGGSITVESAPGSGCVATLRIPPKEA